MAACTSFATEIHIIIPTWVNATIPSRDSHAIDATSYTSFSLMQVRRGCK